MPRARIDYLESADRVTFAYRPAFNPFTPAALFWSLFGGIGAGIGAAVGLVAAGTVPIDQGPQDFRTVVIAGIITASLLLFALGLLRGLRRRPMRVVFNYDGQQLMIHRENQRRMLRVPFPLAITFRLADNGPQHCTLFLEADGALPEPLITVPGTCHDDRSRLPQLTGRLNAHLDALRAVPDDLPMPARFEIPSNVAH